VAILIASGADTYSATTGIPSGDFTVTCWAYVGTVKDPAGVITFDDGAFTQWYILATRPDWGLRSNGLNLASGTTPTAAVWWKLAFVLSGTTATLYGATELSTVAQMCTGTLTASTRTRLTIGGTPDTTQFWNGRIAAVKTWTAALTLSECTAELAQFSPVRTANLQRYHPFHVAETTDYSGNGFTLTAGTATTAADPSIPDTVTTAQLRVPIQTIQVP
jgi:hypothetical protein